MSVLVPAPLLRYTAEVWGIPSVASGVLEGRVFASFAVRFLQASGSQEPAVSPANFLDQVLGSPGAGLSLFWPDSGVGSALRGQLWGHVSRITTLIDMHISVIYELLD